MNTTDENASAQDLSNTTDPKNDNGIASKTKKEYSKPVMVILTDAPITTRNGVNYAPFEGNTQPGGSQPTS